MAQYCEYFAPASNRLHSLRAELKTGTGGTGLTKSCFCQLVHAEIALALYRLQGTEWNCGCAVHGPASNKEMPRLCNILAVGKDEYMGSAVLLSLNMRGIGLCHTGVRFTQPLMRESVRRG